MPVEIKIYTVLDPDRTERQQIEQSMEALGFTRNDGAAAEVKRLQGLIREDQAKLQSSTKIAEQEVAVAEERATFTGDVEVQSGGTHEIKRERGKPSPGKARRTKEEIAEDEAADAADEAKHNEHLDTVEDIQENGFHGTTTPSNISTGGERINPEEEAQDAADEAAETERNGGLQPRERLRKALGSLGIKAGVEAVKPGGLIGMTIDQVPEDQIEAMIAKIEALKNGGESEPADLKRERTEDRDEVVKSATKDDLMQAMLDYAEVFDGTRNPAEAKLAQVDAGEVFKLLFGEGVSKLSAVPADGYDKAIAGIKEAIEKNPFKRERKG